MNPPEEIETDRLLLRRVRADDEDAMLALHTDPETSRHRPAGPATSDEARADLKTWMREWEEEGIGYWAIALANTAEVIGFGGLRNSEEAGRPVFNLYYRFRPATWGNGYAPEMAAAAVDWARRERPDRPVIIRTRPQNVPARRVAEKLGFSLRAEHDSGGHPELVYRLG